MNKLLNDLESSLIKSGVECPVVSLNDGVLCLSIGSSIPSGVQKFKKVKILFEDTDNLPDDFTLLKGITHLDISVNHLKLIPSSLWEVTSLEWLNLHGCSLKKLTPGFNKLAHLKTLIVSSNYLGSIPNEIGDLEKLEALYLYNNFLQSLPDSIGKLKNLRRLGVSNNRLTKLPDSIGNLEMLEMLSLGFNEIHKLPDSIYRLKNLKEVFLIHNQISDAVEFEYIRVNLYGNPGYRS